MKLTINNFGPLDDATIQIGDFTVLAGPNNTGKSFVSKSLYSLFDAINANHALVAFEAMIQPLEMLLPFLEKVGYTSEKISLSALRKENQKVEAIIHQTLSADFPQTESEIGKTIEIQPHLTEAIDRLVDNYSTLLREMLRKQENHFPAISLDFLDELKETFSDAELVTKFGLHVKATQNIQENFQVPDPSYLKREKSSPLRLHIEGIGEFKEEKEEYSFRPYPGGIQKLRQHSRVLYLESPIYWKLKEALESLRLNPRFSSNKKQMNGVPGYFYGLVSALLTSSPHNDIFYPHNYISQDLDEQLAQAVGGKIVISDNNELLFQENGKSFPLSQVATGVSNLGFLGLLIEKGILDRGTFLFIDEPEAHLHPAWQVIMAEILFELARQGVKVVIATHSVDIIQWLEVHIKKHPDDEELVALNKFPVNNSDVDEDFETKIAKISEELTTPFSDLYIEGI